MLDFSAFKKFNTVKSRKVYRVKIIVTFTNHSAKYDFGILFVRYLRLKVCVEIEVSQQYIIKYMLICMDI